jgi:hypothetical protein
MSCLSREPSLDCQPLGNNSSTYRSLLQLHKHYYPSNTGPKDLSVGNRELSRMESLPFRYLAQKEWLRTLYLVFSVPCQKMFLFRKCKAVCFLLPHTHYQMQEQASLSNAHTLEWPGFRSAVGGALHHPSEVPHTSHPDSQSKLHELQDSSLG